MVVGEVADRAEAVVVGAGPGGYEAALQLADHGKRVVLIERQAIGGVCLNIGCIPSKALIHQADIAHLSVAESGSGLDVSVDPNPLRMLQHRQKVVGRLTDGVRGLLTNAGVECWEGSARFARADRLVVEHGGNVKHLEFDNCVLAVGGRPLVLPGLEPGVHAGVEVLDSTGALALDRVPESIVVVGGGYIGVELGTAFAKLGSSVTIVEMDGSLLPAMEPSLGRVVRRRLADLGVRVELNSRAAGLTSGGLTITGSERQQTVATDCVIIAVGRTPNTDQLNLSAAGLVTTPDGLIDVAPDRKAAPRIYAIGDITAGPALAHKATAEAKVAADAIAGVRAAFDPACIPELVFSDPEVASVGLSPAAAKELDPGSRSARIPYTANGRALTLGDASGFVQVVVDGAGTVVGAQLAGHGVSELIAEVGFAIEMAATATDLASTIHPHPTMSEALMEAARSLAH